MSFVDELFPLGVAKSSRGGPRMSMSVVEGDGGVQERARRWASFRWEYEAGIGIQTYDDLDQVYAHHLAVGPENSFPFVDPIDNSSAPDNRSAPASSGTLDQVIGVGDASQATFQLIKTYTFGTRAYVRNIRKPTSGTVNISVAGSLRTLGVHYTLDGSTGIVTFLAGSIPGMGAVITAGFNFRVPVFYGAEFRYSTSYDAITAGRVPDLPLVEDVSQGAITPEWPYLGGSENVPLSGDALYDYAWGRSPTLTPDVDGHVVTLPAIADLPFGGPLFSFINGAVSGTRTITFVTREAGTTVFTLPITRGAILFVRRDTGGSRVWHAIAGA